MTRRNYHTATVRIRTTLLFLLFLGILVWVNREVFDFVGWLEPITVCLLGGGSVLFVSRGAWRCQQKLVVPPGAVVALAAVLVAATWVYPSTPRTRFFADAAQVKVGMTARDIGSRLGKYVLFISQSKGVIHGLNAKPVGSDSLLLRFNGYLVCTPDNTYGGDTASFQLKDGKVIAVHCYSNAMD